MVDPKFNEGNAEMLICGNDSDAKQQVIRILEDFGWPDAIDVGGMEGARWLEALVPLWVRVAQVFNTWSHAFKALR